MHRQVFGVPKIMIEHRYIVGFIYPIPIPKWKWEIVSIDFTRIFPRL